MNYWLTGLLGLLALACTPASARINCSITSPGITVSYPAGVTLSEQSYFSVSCSRQTGDPLSVTYAVGVDNGLYANGAQNRAREQWWIIPIYMNYDMYRNAACSSAWTDTNNTRISDTITWSGGTDTSLRTKQTAYWTCIPSQTGMYAGAYEDTVTFTLQANNVTTATGVAAVKVYAPAACDFTATPTNINFTYTAFGAAVTASTTFSTECSRLMPYTLAVSPTTGTVVGLTYSLSLSATSATGTGGAQNFTITGTMPAGQPGSCNGAVCTGSVPHTVTLSY
ncbi:spore coat protein U domain-containing protein [uncultured Ramlibacter sp.]|uniref:spore coat protein U domain-containing protein n=1 Tax=uncultured Ramlibacter sp. TaxID=260755 RepID=UPI002615A175|nr:spore coat protein U domain-containing protein [uncultured Ramlibacter sp.]